MTVELGKPAAAAAPSANGSAADAPVIEADNLGKIYGSFAAVQKLTFAIPKGQVVAFLGPNGAGKSTTMKMLTGYMAPSTGEARICGIPVAGHRTEVARQVGYLPENGPLYRDMTPRTLLQFLGKARGMGGETLKARIAEVVELCNLKTVIGKPIGKLSKGYRQRVGMAHVLLHEPDVLIMDEPTSGLDPNQIAQVRDTIREIGREKTIMLSTHVLQEVEAMADRVLFLYNGRLVFDGPLAEFGSGHDMNRKFADLTTGAPVPVS